MTDNKKLKEQIEKLIHKTIDLEEEINMWVHNLFINYADLRRQSHDIRFKLWEITKLLEDKNGGTRNKNKKS